ncbi:MAG TPA: hypothetical protein VIK71_02450 [Flavobacteriales bacterium]|jgi:hypothetical protein
MLTTIFQSLLLLFTLHTFVAPAPPKCSRVKHGVFILDDETSGVTIITRENDIQREENKELGVILEDKVQWLNECTYRLIPYRVIQNNSHIDFSEDLQLEIEILEVHKEYYLQRTTSHISNMSVTKKIFISNEKTKKKYDK